MFVISVQNAYARDWLESRLSSTVVRILTGMMNRTVEVRFIVWQDQEAARETLRLRTRRPDEDGDNIFPINQRSEFPGYTFDNFVVGASNRLSPRRLSGGC